MISLLELSRSDHLTLHDVLLDGSLLHLVSKWSENEARDSPPGFQACTRIGRKTNPLSSRSALQDQEQQFLSVGLPTAMHTGKRNTISTITMII